MSRTGRSTLGLVFLVGLIALGLLTASYAIWAQGTQIRANQQTIRQQQRALDALLVQTEQDRQEQAEQRRLIRALQAQVRQLGGTPLLQAPTVRPTPATASARPAATPTRAAATPKPSPRPSRTPRPRSSPTPTTSPSPNTPVCVVSICIPPRRFR